MRGRAGEGERRGQGGQSNLRSGLAKPIRGCIPFSPPISLLRSTKRMFLLLFKLSCRAIWHNSVVLPDPCAPRIKKDFGSSPVSRLACEEKERKEMKENRGFSFADASYQMHLLRGLILTLVLK